MTKEDKLQEALDQFSGEDWEPQEEESPFWKPQEIGDSIQGRIEEEKEVKHGTAFVIVDEEEDEENWLGSYTAIDEEDIRNYMQEEAEIGIVYTGKDTGPNGPYKTFKIFKKSEETPSAS